MEEYPVVLEDFPEFRKSKKMSHNRKKRRVESRCEYRKNRKLKPSTVSMGLKCDMCGRTDRLTAHHKVAVSDGGKNNPENIAVLCTTCHDIIHGRDPHKH